MNGLSRDRYLYSMSRYPPPQQLDLLCKDYRARKAIPLRPPRLSERLSRVESTPRLILDCPGLLNDFYLHVLDWSSENLISVALNCEVYSYSCATRDVLQLICSTDDAAYISAIRSFDRGAKLAAAQCTGCAIVVDLGTGSRLCQFMVEDECRAPVIAEAPRLSPSTVLFGTKTGKILAYDLRGKCHAPTHSVSVHLSEVCGLDASSTDDLVASGGNDHQLLVWDPRMWRPLLQIREHTAAVRAISWCSWRRGLLASGGGQGDRTLKLWNTSTGSELGSVECGSQVSDCFWLGRDKDLVTTHGFDTHDFVLWAYPDLDRLSSIKAHDSRILQAALSPDGALLATAAANESLKVWKVA